MKAGNLVRTVGDGLPLWWKGDVGLVVETDPGYPLSPVHVLGSAFVMVLFSASGKTERVHRQAIEVVA